MKTKVNQHIFSSCGMTNSSLDNVNELLRLDYGDEYRLKDIRRRLDNGQILYNSDNNVFYRSYGPFLGDLFIGINSWFYNVDIIKRCNKYESACRK